MYDPQATTFFIQGAVQSYLESVHLLRLYQESFSLTKNHVTQNGGRKLWFSRAEFSRSSGFM